VTAPVFVVPPAALASVAAGGVVRLDGPEGRHAVTVRRLASGEAVDLVDGQGRRASGRVDRAEGKDVLYVNVEEISDEEEAWPRVVVVQALAKGERGELATELLTEVGVDVIVPWSAANCVTQWRGERADKSRQRWIDAAGGAAKQARRSRFPEVSTLASTPDVAARLGGAALGLVLHEGADDPISDVSVPSHGDVVIVVGPEGGLTAAEVEQFAAAGARPVRLGSTVLRTSSAGLAAAAVILSRTERWSDAPTGRPARGMEG
jgi:16S rRNA (uracil1498-N3)-methyltransferase